MIPWVAEDHALDVGTLAPLTRLGAVLGANTLHLDGRVRDQRSFRNGGGLLTLAARQTVHALAPRTTGGFLWRDRSAERGGGSGVAHLVGTSGVERWDWDESMAE
jgi:hypothetical protein